MKAIEIDGTVKLFGALPKNFTIDETTIVGFNRLSDADLLQYGCYDVILPEFDSQVQELSNLHKEGDVYTYDVVDIKFAETLAELKENKIKGLKLAVGEELSKTDWYIIREADSGEATPADVRGERAALRTKSDSIEAEINALTTKKSVVLFDINL
jgi:hypothetical protein